MSEPTRGPADQPDTGGPTRAPRRLSPLTPLVRGGILLLAMVATSWDDLLAGRLGPVGLTLLGVLVVGGVIGYASWLRTKYWIEADELRIDTGVISHQSRQIRIDRLQGIDIVQPFVARLFGLAELRMDTAGGDREGSLAFLPLAEAQRLRQTLLAKRDAVRRADPTDDGSRAEGPSPPRGWSRDWAPPDHDIAVLGLRTLVLSVVFSPTTVALLVGGAFFGWIFANNGVVMVAPGLPVVAGFVLLQVRRLSAYYGFTVSRTSAGLQVRRGLLERSSQTIALARVQGVVITEPWMWRPWGWARLDVSIAGYGSGGESEGGPSASTVMPVAARVVVLRLAQDLLRGEDAGGDDGGGDDDGKVEVDPDVVRTSPPPDRARWLEPVGRRFLGAGLGADVAVAREGRFTRRTHVVRHARVQSLRLAQGPLQRALGLADVHLDSPPGPVHVRFRHRAADDARVLLDQEQLLARAARAARSARAAR